MTKQQKEIKKPKLHIKLKKETETSYRNSNQIKKI